MSAGPAQAPPPHPPLLASLRSAGSHNRGHSFQDWHSGEQYRCPDGVCLFSALQGRKAHQNESSNRGVGRSGRSLQIRYSPRRHHRRYRKKQVAANSGEEQLLRVGRRANQEGMNEVKLVSLDFNRGEIRNLRVFFHVVLHHQAGNPQPLRQRRWREKVVRRLVAILSASPTHPLSDLYPYLVSSEGLKRAP